MGRARRGRRHATRAVRRRHPSDTPRSPRPTDRERASRWPVSPTPSERAMLRALELSRTPGVPLGPNPRVGCVLLDAERRAEVAEGFHRGAGTPHAEVAALAEAGDRARGATAVVTLEPCNHTGRTGPAREALIEAGVRRVVFAQPDPNPVAAGGAEALRGGRRRGRGRPAGGRGPRDQPAWTFAVDHQRPFVTWKFATTLDGRSAAADGTSRWVSSVAGPARHPPAPRAVRRHAGRHQHRRRRRPRADRPRRASTSRCRGSRCAW